MEILLTIVKYFFGVLGIIFFVLICGGIYAILRILGKLDWLQKYNIKWLWCKHIHKSLKVDREWYMSSFDIGHHYKYFFKCEKCEKKWFNNNAEKEYRNE